MSTYTLTPAAGASAGPADGTTHASALTDRRQLLLLAGVVVLVAASVLLLRGAVAATAALHPLAGPDAPWIPRAAVWLVVAVAPVAVASAIVLLMAPGLLLALAFDRAPTAEAWILEGFVLSLVAVSSAAAIAQAILGAPLTGGAFVATVLVLSGLALLLALWRLRSGATIRWPLAAPHAGATLLGMALVPLAILIALAPKFYWEAFNGDGVHAYETARLLLHQAVPFFDPAAGEIAGFPGTTSFLFAYPASWFLRLFGEMEASARLPLLLFLPPLAAVIIMLVNERTSSILRSAERWLIWLALIVYVVVIAFSATYSPYSADIALPATQDTLLVVGFLGYVLSFLRRSWGWAAAYALLTFVSLPNGLLLLGFWLAGWFLVNRPLPWRSTLLGGAIIFACMVVGALLPHISALAGGPEPGGEYGVAGLVRRFAYLQVTDWTRFAYLLVPCGIVPALALLWWERQDTIARAITIVTFAYFLFAFVQAHAPLHYYIPAMVLPMVVFWRMDPAAGPRRRAVLAVTAAAAVVALVVSWPADTGPYTAAREVGRTIEIRFAGYDRFDPVALRASTLLHRLVPYDWDPNVPQASLGGSPLAFQYYAHTRSAADGPPNAFLQPVNEPPPAGATAIAKDDDAALYVVDDRVWQRQLALRPASPVGAWIYQEPRGILFRSVPLNGGPYIIDLPAIAERMGVDVDGLARRLGVER